MWKALCLVHKTRNLDEYQIYFPDDQRDRVGAWVMRREQYEEAIGRWYAFIFSK